MHRWWQQLAKIEPPILALSSPLTDISRASPHICLQIPINGYPSSTFYAVSKSCNYSYNLMSVYFSTSLFFSYFSYYLDRIFYYFFYFFIVFSCMTPYLCFVLLFLIDSNLYSSLLLYLMYYIITFPMFAILKSDTSLLYLWK